MILGTIPASSTGTISLTYLPSNIHFDIATVPTSVKVNVLGDGVICDLDGAGVSAASRIMRVGNLSDQYIIPLADGIVRGKNVEITITNAEASVLTVYGYSQGIGSTYVQSLQQKVFASSGVELADFFEAAFPAFVAADEMNITYRGGFTQRFSPDDLRIDASFSTYVDDTASDYRALNESARIGKINFIPNADQQVYVFRYRKIGNL